MLTPRPERDLHQGPPLIQSRDGFHLGQQGDFVLRDAFNRPYDRVHGRIVRLIEGHKALYALIEIEPGVCRPGRLVASD